MMVQLTRGDKLRGWFVLTLIAVVIGVSCLALVLGRYPIAPTTVIEVLRNEIFHNAVSDPTNRSIVMTTRLPRIVLALFVGCGLAVAGSAFQSLFSNPLATPDTLGVAAGTCVGAVIGLMLDWNIIGVQLLALICGLITVYVAMIIAKTQGQTSIVMLILAGVVMSAVANAIISILKLVADPTSKLPEITYWLMGSLAGVQFSAIALGIPGVVIGLIVIYLLRWRLNILSLSEDEIRATGVNVKILRPLIIGAATLITASVVSMCGQVGWIGLLVPHCARMLVGNNSKVVIPTSMLLGSCFMVIIDTLARTVSASEIPISVLTALVGAPFFISLLRSSGGRWR
ncbi:ABC transporter transmembrane protein [Corynebacterium kutscheri]|uniref:ABC transporter transmembrane protein n=1 Tax=Corynebacterium kutscheri TaxID=35755 RepID=A0A0F6QY50_9CORY|nr:iron ABC transporter permease [Corynebacterium kutscheri]AKE40352.1 ABC-type Fe3+-siderophore transport system, permease component [Corynebacterium kutscheri]VEH05377.1 ABC transporter transmembrane protein [Corynebacterium kutscheri]VEH10746.1 ABC transporter transmembrane protein [Corynebacterium kutscheri]VEH80774.1 ABC transporter transmembrane protein [Corynebacterium kutscheri]